MLHHKWEGVQMTQQREEREKTNHPKQLSCTVQPQGEGLEGAQGHLEQAQSWANEFPPLEMLSCIDMREEICFFIIISLWYRNFYMSFCLCQIIFLWGRIYLRLVSEKQGRTQGPRRWTTEWARCLEVLYENRSLDVFWLPIVPSAIG